MQNLTQDQLIELGRALQSIDVLELWLSRLSATDDQELFSIVATKLQQLNVRVKYANEHFQKT